MTDRTVLIVDDSPVVRRVLLRRLEELGYRCIEASNGAEAAVVAITERPDLVVTDLEMPVMDGFQLARLLKSDETTEHIPVVVLTSHGEASSRFWSLHTGADRFVTKSEDFSPVVEAVEDLAKGLGERAGRPLVPATETPAPLEIIGRVARKLDERLLETTLAQNLLERGVSAENLTEAVDGVMEVLETVVDASEMAILVADPGKPFTLYSRRRQGRGEERSQDLAGSIAAAANLDPHADVEMVELQPLRERHVSSSGRSRPVDEREVDPCVFRLPLREARGILAVVPLFPQSSDELPRRLLQSLSSQIGMVLDNARLSERLRELSTLDGLTRLLNHRAILDRLEQEVQRLKRYGGETSVILMDLDHFKEVNDEWGHLAGDEVLREIAERLREHVRTADVVGRYGGEEFLVVLPAIGLETALSVAERLRRYISEPRISYGENLIQITASFGVASIDEAGGEGPQEVLALADERLYEAKRAGRNCIRP